MIKAEMPIKYRILGANLEARFGKEQKWSFIRRLIAGKRGKEVNSIGWGFGKDFIYNGSRKEWRGKWFYKDVIGVNGHSGNDFAAITGTSYYAPITGEVIFVRGNNPTYGETISILSDEFRIDGKRHKIVALGTHLEEEYVKVGDRVNAGDFIGECGNTGKWSTGAHLHLGFRLLELFINNGTMIEYPYAKGWGYKKGLLRRGYFDFKDMLDYKIKRDSWIEKNEGKFLQWVDGVGATGAVYEIIDGELVWQNPYKNLTGHIPFFDRIIKLLKTGIEPNSIIGINTEQYLKYKYLIK